MTATVVPADVVRLPSWRTLRFVGGDHGPGISFFLVDSEPGQARPPSTSVAVTIQQEYLVP